MLLAKECRILKGFINLLRSGENQTIAVHNLAFATLAYWTHKGTLSDNRMLDFRSRSSGIEPHSRELLPASVQNIKAEVSLWVRIVSAQQINQILHIYVCRGVN